MHRVVYLLGAGFSADLGLPLMADFLEKAKDQYYASTGDFDHFKGVLDTINSLHVCSSYYNADLFNIEEILSILEMQSAVTAGRSPADFRRFIADVIVHYTPPLENDDEASSWASRLFFKRPWLDYGPFVAALLGCRFARDKSVPESGAVYSLAELAKPSVEYSVVTLNYDLVLETIATAIHERHGHQVRFTRSNDPGIPLAKLHGSVDTNDIVAPTWNKGIRPDSIGAAWELAYRLLRDANHIRIIGYSLPMGDAYVRFLLKAAVVDAPNLKQLDVICKDPTGLVKERYAEFVTFRKWRFQPDTTFSYLLRLSGVQGSQYPMLIEPSALEQAHGLFMGA